MAEPYSMASHLRHKAITYIHWNTLAERQKGNTIHDWYFFKWVLQVCNYPVSFQIGSVVNRKVALRGPLARSFVQTPQNVWLYQYLLLVSPPVAFWKISVWESYSTCSCFLHQLLYLSLVMTCYGCVIEAGLNKSVVICKNI